MIPEKLPQILEHECVAAIATQGEDGPHLVNTWNTYVQIDGNTLLIPVGGMKQTEENLKRDDRVLMTLGSKHVEGLRGPGAGFLLTGRGTISTSGARYERVKARFDWARAVLEIDVMSAEETL